ncbi:MAG: thioredoxin-like domain-containing protein [Bacteroidota bacterium]
MKYLTIVLVIAFSFFCHKCYSAENSPKEVTNIHLKVNGLSDEWVYLYNVHENQKSRLDSTLTDGVGNAYFKSNELLPQGYYSIILPDSVVLDLLVGEDQVFSLSTNLTNPIVDMQVEGSLENELLYSNLKYDLALSESYRTEIEKLKASGTEISSQFINQFRSRLFAERNREMIRLCDENPNTLFAKYYRAQEPPQAVLGKIMTDKSLSKGERTYLMLDHYWDGVDFSDSRLLNTPVIFNRLSNYFYQFSPNQTFTKLRAIDVLMEKVADYPDYYKFFAVWIAEEYQPAKATKIDEEALYVHMVDNYLNEERAFWADSLQIYAWQYRAGDKAKSLVGKKGQNIEAKDPQDKMQSLYDIDDPYIAIFFYDATCEHCQETAPKLATFYQEWKGKGLEVYAVVMNTPKEEWKAFIKESEMEAMINVTDEDHSDTIFSNYYIMGTPYIYLLNPDRTIIAKDLLVEEIGRYITLDKQKRE